ncbi:hypothetical protein C4N9_20455 [Pararhodobacter marinus]|uniref:DUF4376 domain-containing protein n=1 Tax=Pararhodobacter marinus TaxID=2184063 RepID=A0A2U2C4J8_9RHOB|nr:DUF4376 domain-containing protein [Pararhodobacter marinus]PWE26810.1 hypothetical protein C4N9_20455 [Pararhodobacter marinus]
MTFELTIETAEDLAALEIEAERARLKARRDQALVSGITVAGMPIATDDTSQSRIVGAALAVINDPNLTIQWKTEAGFVTLDAAQVLAVAQAVRAHVQACFDREAELLDALDAGEAYDAEVGWP